MLIWHKKKTLMDFLFVENKPFNTTSIHREGGGVHGGGEK